MATTTNYSWTTPDDTALVKDGAAAIRTLGSSIDTTTKALNPSTTLGDIEYRSSTANTNTRLAIGSTGNVLTVAGGVPTWAAPAAGGGLTLLSTTTLSGASTTISSINQTYKSLKVLIIEPVVSASFALRLAPNGDIASSDYTGTTNAIVQEASSGYILPLLGNNQGQYNAPPIITIDFDNYASTTVFKSYNLFGGFHRQGTGPMAVNAGGIYRSTSAISSLVFSPSSGTFSSGSILVYGVN